MYTCVYVFFLFFLLFLLEYEFDDSRGLVYLQLYLQNLDAYLAYSECIINIYQMDTFMQERWDQIVQFLELGEKAIWIVFSTQLLVLRFFKILTYQSTALERLTQSALPDSMTGRQAKEIESSKEVLHQYIGQVDVNKQMGYSNINISRQKDTSDMILKS